LQHVRALAAQTVQRLNENYRCLHLNSPQMIAVLRSALESRGADVKRECANGSLILSSGQDHLVDGRFDVNKMIQMLEDAIDAALHDGYRGLWASGDMSWEFGPQKDFSRLLEYEWRLEEVFNRRPALMGICQYHGDTLPREAMRHGLETHPSVFINETLSKMNPHYARRPLFTHGDVTIKGLDAAIEDLFRLGSATAGQQASEPAS
jgi:hypothetical protein